MSDPRSLCTCGDFEYSSEYDDEADFLRCANCRGWLSKQRFVDDPEVEQALERRAILGRGWNKKAPFKRE
jgi:hypothetical protein